MNRTESPRERVSRSLDRASDARRIRGVNTAVVTRYHHQIHISGLPVTQAEDRGGRGGGGE